MHTPIPLFAEPNDQREISAKLSKNTYPSEQINEQYQYELPYEKIVAKNSSERENTRRAAEPKPLPPLRISTATAN